MSAAVSRYDHLFDSIVLTPRQTGPVVMPGKCTHCKRTILPSGRDVHFALSPRCQQAAYKVYAFGNTAFRGFLPLATSYLPPRPFHRTMWDQGFL